VTRWARVPATVLADEGLSRNDWRVFVALALHANPYGEARPSQQALSAAAQLSRRTVRRSVDTLAVRGHVIVDDRGGGNRAARYVLRGFTDDVLGAPVRPKAPVYGRTRAPNTAGVGAPVRPTTPDAGEGVTSMGANPNLNGRKNAPEWAHGCATNKEQRTDARDTYACGHPLTDPAGMDLGDGKIWCAACTALTKGT